jgi:hypothetical protein
VISATQTPDGKLYATFAKEGQAQLSATLLPVDP